MKNKKEGSFIKDIYPNLSDGEKEYYDELDLDETKYSHYRLSEFNEKANEELHRLRFELTNYRLVEQDKEQTADDKLLKDLEIDVAEFKESVRKLENPKYSTDPLARAIDNSSGTDKSKPIPMENKKCKVCGGTGKCQQTDIDWDDCRHCNGSGVEPPAKEKEHPKPKGTESDRDWKEDYEQENGNYQNKCVYCNELFYGNKYRVVCKCCDNRIASLEAELKKSDLALNNANHCIGVLKGELAEARKEIERLKLDKLERKN